MCAYVLPVDFNAVFTFVWASFDGQLNAAFIFITIIALHESRLEYANYNIKYRVQ